MYDQNFKVKPLATLCRMYPLLGGNVYVTLVYCKETVYCIGVLACIMCIALVCVLPWCISLHYDAMNDARTLATFLYHRHSCDTDEGQTGRKYFY